MTPNGTSFTSGQDMIFVFVSHDRDDFQKDGGTYKFITRQGPIPKVTSQRLMNLSDNAGFKAIFTALKFYLVSLSHFSIGNLSMIIYCEKLM